MLTINQSLSFLGVMVEKTRQDSPPLSQANTFVGILSTLKNGKL